MSKELKAAVIGTGIFATDQHLPTFNKIPYITPVSCYNRTKAKAEVFAEKAQIDKSKIYESLEEAFKDDNVDFVDALLPVQYNLDVVKLAVENKKPLALEKPLAANLKQASEIVKVAESSDVPIGILENVAFNKAVGLLQEQLPKIGKVVGFNYRSTGPYNSDNKYLATSWRQKPEHIGGYLSDGGVHQLTFLTEVLGPVAYVSAQAAQLRELSGCEDHLFSTFKLESGAIGTFTYGTVFGASKKVWEFNIYGDKGSLDFYWDLDAGEPTISLREGENKKDTSAPIVTVVKEVDAYEQEFINFADAVFKNDKSVLGVSPRKAFHHLAIVDAALKSSSDNGSSVKVAQP